MKKPELLLPVGNRDMLEAAIHNGADAVYFGVPHFNARGRTEDFTFENVKEMIIYARIYGVKTYLAMNILIFEREIQELPDYLEKLISLEPDAFIIQDIGLAKLIKAISPNQEIHASTQMTLASTEAINLVATLGFKRVVLARELSLEQILFIKNNTQLELEIFIHGALCVSYSGQCLTSENFGGRSANRGQCAQSCRLPYRLFVDEKEYKNFKIPFLFSPHDLCAIPKIEEIKKIGIESLKVEGRLKSKEYVAAVSKAYRKVLDYSLKELNFSDYEPLEILFSRGLGLGFLDGINHQKLVDGTFSNHHGEYLGEVLKIEKDFVIVITKSKKEFPINYNLHLGDGILFENQTFNVNYGSRLYNYHKKFKNNTTLLYLKFGKDFDFKKINPEMKVYRNDSPFIEKELKKTYTDRELLKRIPIDMILSGTIGNPLILTIIENNKLKLQVESDYIIEKCINEKINNNNNLLKELSALSNTAYILKNLDIQINSNIFIPNKFIRTLRQKAITELNKEKIKQNNFNINANNGRIFLLNEKNKKLNNFDLKKEFTPSITVLVRNPNQVLALKNLKIDNVIMDFDWGVKYDNSLSQIRDYGFKAGIATLRIHKPKENHYLKNILHLAPDFTLVRNLGALSLLKNEGIPIWGDYSLNASNSLSFNWLIEQGLESLHPSWDLNSTQLFELINNINKNKLELSLHQYMSAFHSEYCVFARTLTNGRRFPECKKICTKHKIEILDHKNERHFLQSDAECRNTLFVGKPQSALKLLPKLKNYGVSKFRLEFLDDSFEMIRNKIQIYSKAIKQNYDIDKAIQMIGAEEKYGISNGQLFNENLWIDRKKS